MKFRNEKYCNEKFLFCFLWCSYCLNSKHCVDEASRFGIQLSNNVNTSREIVDELHVRGKSKNNYTPQQTKTICKIEHRFIAVWGWFKDLGYVWDSVGQIQGFRLCLGQCGTVSRIQIMFGTVWDWFKDSSPNEPPCTSLKIYGLNRTGLFV